MATKTRKPASSQKPGAPGNTGKSGLGGGGNPPPVAYQFKPGQSGNPAGRPQGDHIVRGIIAEALSLSRPKAVEMMRRRLENIKYVQDVLELYAKLEGELSKDADGGGRGIAVLVLNNMGDRPLDPETFRAGMLRPAEAVVELEVPPDRRGA